jgi:uncharacterized protein (TIGR02246 family)
VSAHAPNITLIDRQLAAYNAQDMDAMMACYAPDAQLFAPDGTCTEKSSDEIRARYVKAFATFPQNKATVKNRIVVGATVVDHEHVVRAPGGEEFEIIAIYTITDGRIVAVHFAK